MTDQNLKLFIFKIVISNGAMPLAPDLIRGM
ncbi:MAG: hypothetical protein UT48_C0021G0011 [Parcubacteria group bacterium GW2011_GWE2_39_37]|nr:MAG: hypothetical protein UT48_C0021G0011 [Parcubacteria group bacterium GW2011_GWE2_39_37]